MAPEFNRRAALAALSGKNKGSSAHEERAGAREDACPPGNRGWAMAQRPARPGGRSSPSRHNGREGHGQVFPPVGSLGVASGEPQGSLRVASGWPRGAYRLATTWPVGGLGVASGPARDAIPPVPPKTVKRGPQPPKSAIDSHLRLAESFRVHGPTSTSESVAVSTPPPRNNSLRYSGMSGRLGDAVLPIPSKTAKTPQFPLIPIFSPQKRMPRRSSPKIAERRDRRMCRLALQSHLLVKSDPPMLKL